MKRLGIISLFVLLFAAFIAIWDFSYRTGREEAYIPIETEEDVNVIPQEMGVFTRAEHALDYSKMEVDEDHQRSLDSYYDNRAFYGAPPSIPHPVVEKQNVGDASCLKCHENGGYVEKFNAYTPVAPHPQWVNCKQCHVAQKEQTLFKQGNYAKLHAPAVGVNSAFLGGPPTIPHPISMRENCLSCHAGPSAPREIRVTHPERINCRQCHVPNQEEEPTEIFLRNNDDE